MRPPSVTVCIPVYNGAVYIRDAMGSVLNQTFEEWSLVICDNSSTDGTDQIVAPYLADPRVSFLPSATNVGMAANYTRCLAAVATPYFMILCHDDLLYRRDSLAQALKVLERHPNVVAVYSNMVYVDKKGAPVAHRRFGTSGIIDPRQIALASIRSARNLFGIPVMIRTAATRGMRFDPSLPYIIDLDFSIGMCKDGAAIYRIPEFLVAYRYHGLNATASLLRGVSGQLMRLASKHGIALTLPDRARVRYNAWKAALLKRVFGIYVERIHK